MIRKICFVLALTLSILYAEDQPAPKKAKSKKTPPPPAELTLPPGAKMTEPGTYTFTDTQGKKWIYRKTPFGLARLEDKPAPPIDTPTPASTITATEDGETVRFERPGPFGMYRWQKKKSDLTDDEKTAWERSEDKNASDTKAKQE